MFILSSVINGSIYDAYQYIISGSSISFWSLVLLSGFTGIGVTVTTYLFLSMSTPTSFAVIGVLKKISQTFLGYFFWKSVSGWQNIASVIVGLCGGIMYGISQKAKQTNESK